MASAREEHFGNNVNITSEHKTGTAILDRRGAVQQEVAPRQRPGLKMASPQIWAWRLGNKTGLPQTFL